MMFFVGALVLEGMSSGCSQSPHLPSDLIPHLDSLHTHTFCMCIYIYTYVNYVSISTYPDGPMEVYVSYVSP